LLIQRTNYVIAILVVFCDNQLEEAGKLKHAELEELEKERTELHVKIGSLTEGKYLEIYEAYYCAERS